MGCGSPSLASVHVERSTTPQYVYSFDITGWGWVHLILGVLVAGTGIGVVKGTT